MKDTPQHIQDLQLKLWLSKSPAERLLQFLAENDAMFKFIQGAKKSIESKKNRKPEIKPG